MWPLSPLGYGIGLRSAHFSHLLENPARGVDWFEIISENFFEAGGRPWAVLEKIRAQVPVVAHGVSLYIGDTRPLSTRYLAQLTRLIARIEPAWVSDHLCWGSVNQAYSHDLLPLPYTEEALAFVSDKVCALQDSLRRPILLENVSSYVRFAQSQLSEWEFLAELTRRTGCGLLLDLNNIVVSGFNHGFAPLEYLDGIPNGVIGQLHLAGHSDYGEYLLDSHIGPVPPAVWALYQEAIVRFGPLPTLIEWDEDIPEFAAVAREAEEARRLAVSPTLKGRASIGGLRLPGGQGVGQPTPADLSPAVYCQALGDEGLVDNSLRRVVDLRGNDEPSKSAPVVATELSLPQLQRRFFRLLTAPTNTAEALPEITRDDPGATPLSSWLRGESEEHALRRFDIYSNMYFYRLLDVLRGDYPRLAQLLGEVSFHNLVTDYLLAHPPSEPSLRHLGQHLSGFVAQSPYGKEWPYAEELATFEWARVEVFDAEEEALLTREQLAMVAPEEWAGLCFQLIKALRCLRLRYDIPVIWEALKQGEQPSTEFAAPKETAVLVWRYARSTELRRSLQPYHRTLSLAEADAIAAVGEPFAALCERFGDDLPVAAQRAYATLSQWLEDGLLVGYTIEAETEDE